MSIAVSAVVVPSRRLRALVFFFGGCNAAAGLALAFSPGARFQCAPLCSALFLVAAAFLLHAAARRTKTRRIDISGLGQLRLAVQQGVGQGGAQDAAVPVTVAPGSTVWPQLLLLLLRAPDGGLTVLPVLRDSVTPQQFRALAVAVRAADAGSGDAAGRGFAQ
ncbi:hypothetical protein GCM10027321_32280 [Massilia terrae]|uniref:Flagellar hook-length control protein n=1 Tax=Massilia terrae TaxID=1811224 RepID=A0ABT2CRZ6_9BURK|nr:hypothetical protein [Massilia terrae]MCS0656737.1 hypothetical protein [Massilia terrae]